MKNALICFFALVFNTAFYGHAFSSGPYAPAAGQSGSTAIHKDDTSFVAWATGYVNYIPGTNVDTEWKTPDKSLGQAQGTSTDIVCLGRGGQITLTFNPPIANGPGWDFAIFENSFQIRTILSLGSACSALWP